MTTRNRKEWFDDDSFWQDLYPFMFPEERFESTLEQIEKVLALTKPGGSTALDLCCGPGRCSIALAQAGFTVTGVDRTKFLLDIARKKALAAKTRVEWVQMDMRDFAREAAFDLAINLFSSFGYFDDKSEDMTVLQNIFTSLKPGGVFLIDIMGKERLAKVLLPTTSMVLQDGSKLIELHEVFDDWTRIRNEYILIRKGKAKSFKIHHTLYSGQELRDRMSQAGFSDIKLYGNFDGDDYGYNARRLIAVARKAGNSQITKHRVNTNSRTEK